MRMMRKRCVNEHLSPTSSYYYKRLYNMHMSHMSFCRFVSTQEPVQCATYAHSTPAEWSYHEKVLRGQAGPPQYARGTQEPDRWRELYPSLNSTESQSQVTSYDTAESLYNPDWSWLLFVSQDIGYFDGSSNTFEYLIRYSIRLTQYVR